MNCIAFDSGIGYKNYSLILNQVI